MNVLVITGDKKFGPGHERYELQRSAVDVLEVLYWGRGSLWPKLPEGTFDVVTVQDPFWRGLFGWFVAKRKKAKFNVQIHTDLNAQNFFRHVLAQIVVLHADSVRVVSERIKKQIKTWVKISVLPVFVDVERFTQVVRTPEQMILWIGRFEKEKDPLLALEIASKVSAKLIMLGKGSLEHMLREQAVRLNLTDRVEFSGWQDPAPYLARAGVVLSTSKHESFGASMVEALAVGVPVVAPDVGIAKEAGAIVVSREQLAEAVKEVLEHGTKGELKLHLPSAQDWAKAWRKTL